MSLFGRLACRSPLYLAPVELSKSLFRWLHCKQSYLVCRLYGMRVDSSAYISAGIRFVYPWNVVIGRRCVVGRSVRLWAEDASATLLLNEGVEVGRDCVLDFTGGLTIESGALISEGVIIYSHDHGYEPHSIPIAQPLFIGKNSWIGARAIILPSVRRIGENAIVGAGTVVTKDVPDDHVFVSATGRLIKKNEKVTT